MSFFTDEFPGCCGIEVVHNLPFDHWEQPHQDQLAEAEQALNDLISRYRSKRGKGPSMLMLSLNQYQQNHFGAAVRRAGFRLTRRFYHPTHNSTIYAYQLPLFKREKDDPIVKTGRPDSTYAYG